jgi:hypothetical protein
MPPPRASRKIASCRPVLVGVAATRCGFGHVLMLPAMVIAMLRRREEHLAAH